MMNETSSISPDQEWILQLCEGEFVYASASIGNQPQTHVHIACMTTITPIATVGRCDWYSMIK